MVNKEVERSAASTGGAIDLLYFPPARHTFGTRETTSLPCHEPVESAVHLLNESGLQYVFVTQCKRWSCDRRIYCESIDADEILRYTSPYPQHFIGMSAYDPFDIGASIHAAELGIKHHGFRGIYVHPGSFGIAINDRQMYPLYVKAVDWQIPVVLDLQPLADRADAARVTDVVQVTADFPDLNFILALPPWSADNMVRVASELPNVYFCLDAAAMQTPAGRELVLSAAGQSRCMWGSNGVPWKDSLAEVARLQSSAVGMLLHENAARLFSLHRAKRHTSRRFVPKRVGQSRVAAE